MIDFMVTLLKKHFKLYFKTRNKLRNKFKAGAMVLEIVWGSIFVIHDWIVNWLLTFKFEKPADFFELVSTRMSRYLTVLPESDPRYQWAEELWKFTARHDPEGHG